MHSSTAASVSSSSSHWPSFLEPQNHQAVILQTPLFLWFHLLPQKIITQAQNLTSWSLKLKNLKFRLNPRFIYRLRGHAPMPLYLMTSLPINEEFLITAWKNTKIYKKNCQFLCVERLLNLSGQEDSLKLFQYTHINTCPDKFSKRSRLID